jgi:thiol:disulfide interchange protein DsbD
MEANIFPLPDVQRLFDQFVLVRLYTDGGEPEHEWNREFERERFGTIALPYYAIISPDDETIATFPGMTRDEREFIDFLRKGLNSFQAESIT